MANVLTADRVSQMDKQMDGYSLHIRGPFTS
jgi:hypothetical protein